MLLCEHVKAAAWQEVQCCWAVAWGLSIDSVLAKSLCMASMMLACPSVSFQHAMLFVLLLPASSMPLHCVASPLGVPLAISLFLTVLHCLHMHINLYIQTYIFKCHPNWQLADLFLLVVLHGFQLAPQLIQIH